MVSIIVPFYNAAGYLNQCVESVIAQTYYDIEIILVDDGSNDNSCYISDEYAMKDKRVIVVHKENEGVSVARNVGMTMAHGEYVMFLDADDMMKKNCVEEFMQYRAYSLVIGGYEKFGIQTGLYGPITDKEIDIKGELVSIWEKCPDSYWWFVWGKLFRKDIIINNNLQFKTDMIYLEDFCFVLEYLSQIDNCYVHNSNGILHLIEKSKYSKYRMDYNLLKKHMQAHDDSFSLIEKKCNASFIKMREKIAFRHFRNFMNYLIKSDRPFYERLSNMAQYNKEKNKPSLFGNIVIEGYKAKIGWGICRILYGLLCPLLYLKINKNYK